MFHFEFVAIKCRFLKNRFHYYHGLLRWVGTTNVKVGSVQQHLQVLLADMALNEEKQNKTKKKSCDKEKVTCAGVGLQPCTAVDDKLNFVLTKR